MKTHYKANFSFTFTGHAGFVLPCPAILQDRAFFKNLALPWSRAGQVALSWWTPMIRMTNEEYNEYIEKKRLLSIFSQQNIQFEFALKTKYHWTFLFDPFKTMIFSLILEISLDQNEMWSTSSFLSKTSNRSNLNFHSYQFKNTKYILLFVQFRSFLFLKFGVWKFKIIRIQQSLISLTESYSMGNGCPFNSTMG